jgi:hypothetical protein
LNIEKILPCGSVAYQSIQSTLHIGKKMANGTEVKYKNIQSILTGYNLWSSRITCAASGWKVEKKTGLLLAY